MATALFPSSFDAISARVDLDAVHALVRTGHFEEAIEGLDRILRRTEDPGLVTLRGQIAPHLIHPDLVASLEEADRLAAAGDLAALEGVLHPLAEDPRSPYRVLRLFGGLLAQTGRTAPALEVFLEAVRRFPHLAAARVDLASIHFLRESPEAGLSELRTALDIDPEHPEALHALLAHVLPEDTPEAISLAHRFRRSQPSHPDRETVDAYLRARHEDPDRIVSMSDLNLKGRFGNHLFQYAFLKAYGAQHQATVEMRPWDDGERWFGIRETPIRGRLPPRSEEDILHEGDFDLADPSLLGHDLSGYFQVHTSRLRPHRRTVRDALRLRPELASALEAALRGRLAEGSTLVALHLRRGDYGEGMFFRAPSAWYRRWLEAVWPTIRQPVLWIATDDPDAVLPEFAAYAPLHAGLLREVAAGLSLPDHLVDFFVLTRADQVATSNSSFSVMASLLNETARVFVRPHLPSRMLVGFDPWNTPPLFPHTVDAYPLEPEPPGIV